MRHYKFSIYFTGNEEEIVHASGMTDALILACAERIKKGLHIPLGTPLTPIGTLIEYSKQLTDEESLL